MKSEQPEQLLGWLRSKPSLEELTERFPTVREIVRCDVATLIADGTGAGLPAYLKRLGQAERAVEQKYARSRGDRKIGEALVLQAVQSRMAHLAVKQHLIAEATGIDKGKVRFNLLNGFIAQKLLFRDGLERKPVSLGLFRMFWPLVWQRRLLMPLVQPEGIYCFYSRQLVDELARLIGTRRCLEVAAGDGTLTRFLNQRGVTVTASDDYSWQHEVHYPEHVEKRDAQDALREYAPEVVICSWPPAGNGFEQQIFRTRSVQLYIAIGSRHRIAAGNWQSYQEQSGFEFSEEPRLSALVLPPELDSAVYLFRRKEISQAG